MLHSKKLLRTLASSSTTQRLLVTSSAGHTGRLRHFADSATAGAVAADQELQQNVPHAQTSEGWLWVDSVFPVRLGRWDLRPYIGYTFEEGLLERLRILLSKVNTHDFQVVSLEPHSKDGGVFVKFKYSAEDTDTALPTILENLRENVHSHGGVPSWVGLSTGEVWLVKGSPWKEDLNRYATAIVKVSFDGPDVPEEQLYDLLRPYGKIGDITPPSPAPAGTLRSATVSFRSLRAATTARNAIHSARVPLSSSGQSLTTLRTSYQQPIAAHAIRDYVTSHPKLFLPVLFFLIGTVTYAIFDPIRVLMVEGKMEDWFDYKKFTVYKWLRANTVERFSFSGHTEEPSLASQGVWKERQEAEDSLQKYLTDLPSTICFVHGPQGSGKSRMLNGILKESGRKAMIIDVGVLSKASSDMTLVSGLASQTGYWPIFSFLNSINNIIDLASVGVIGQKAGLSSSLNDQLKQILDVVGRGLSRVNTSHHTQQERQSQQAELKQNRSKENAIIREKIEKGLWHDGRIDAICGNGIMSELGMGIERFTESDADPRPPTDLPGVISEKGERPSESREDRQAEEAKQKQQRAENLHSVESMPVVIIKGFDSKGGGSRKAELLDVLSQWAASLAEGQVAHIIVVSDNRENVKRLAKALPSKPLTQISLSDADNASAMSFVKQKLHESGVDVKFSQQQLAYIDRLGGRASDLESLIHKVRSGLTVEEAVDDLVIRGVSELRKNAFGDDIEDAKSLPWTREQAWILMKQLSKQPQISYHEVLMDFPFKGDETPLRSMEHAELISIGTVNGRPSTIRPGKPVYKYVFERLVHDTTFQATQDIAFNEKVIASAEATVRACEDELLTLKDVDAGTASWWGSKRAVEMRANHLLRKMRTAQEKVETLERQNATLKKVLAKSKA
ncbi:RNA12 protein-domain-containing protein [Lenzites betulinus]|nr:RNA12 protein-domain-containing protein [Lenzites betulinus]